MSRATVTVEPLASPPDVTVDVPGSKSHTNRALVCAALAQGSSRLEGALFADDTVAMMNALEHLGIGLVADPAGAEVTVTGCDGRVPPGPVTIDAAQSGTTGRFLLCLAALGPGPYVLDGDEQLRARPLGHLVEALRTLGVALDGDRLPVTVGPAPASTSAGPAPAHDDARDAAASTGGQLTAGRVRLPGSVSSQFLSGLLLSAPYARPGPDGSGELVIEVVDELVSVPYVELTLATMASFGAKVDHEDYRRFVVHRGGYRARSLRIEPDASAASYFFAAAAITGGRVRVSGLGRHSVQGDVGFVKLLEQMGATARWGDEWIEIEGGSPLVGLDVDLADMSDLAQTLAVVATFATTPTRVRGIGFIRHKETDRISAVVDELTRLGIGATRHDDGFSVVPGRPQPGTTVETYRDHRMAMSFALFGLCHPGIAIADPDCVAKTFPRYFAVLDQLRG
jgi:3-phosphoshikimate 1-carboxyvinyltransferase